jgi:hypothetical protein
MAYTTIDDGSAYFHTQLYTGTGSTNAITNDANAGDFQPDWLWIKERNGAESHALVDSNRGATKHLRSNTTGAELTRSTDVSSFNTDGFTVETDGQFNNSSDTYVAWQWKANGGTTTTNTDGDTNVTLQANATAGFSIGTWNAGGSNPDAVGHGLGAAPEMIIVKRRDSTSNWHVWHQGLGDGNNYILLNSTGAKANDSFEYVSSIGSSTVSLAGGPGSYDEVAYFFRGIKGYSKFGFYTGNGSSSNGTFVYLGFKPRWLLIKKTNGSQSWHVSDTKMKTSNPNTQRLLANSSSAEETRSTTDSIDFLSNGFKCYSNQDIINGNGDSYIYMAFAEHPYVSSKGVPTTAR